MDSSKVKITLIDSHSLFRAGIKRILEKEPQFEVIAEGETINDAARFMNLFDTDIILIDVSTNIQQDLAEIQRLIKDFRSSSIVVISAQEEERLA